MILFSYFLLQENVNYQINLNIGTCRGKVYNSDMCVIVTPRVSQKLQVQLNLFIYESCGYSQDLLT